MPVVSAGALCAAAPIDVWRLVHDPCRLHEWMADTERAGPPDEDGVVTRFLTGWPEYPMPTRVTSTARGGGVTISCLVSDIEFRIALSEDPRGCRVELEARIPEAEAARADAMLALIQASVERIVSVTAGGGRLG